MASDVVSVGLYRDSADSEHSILGERELLGFDSFIANEDAVPPFVTHTTNFCLE